jgi:hypothetical protein
MGESIVKSKAIFSDDRNHRYLLKRVWDEKKEYATIIMLNPSYADELKYDYSSMRAINYILDNQKNELLNKEYGGVNIVNLFSIVETNSSNLPSYNERFNNDTNKYIEKAIKESKDIFIGWGSNRNRKKRVEFIKGKLKGKRIFRFVDGSNYNKHISLLSKNIRLEQLDTNKI